MTPDTRARLVAEALAGNVQHYPHTEYPWRARSAKNPAHWAICRTPEEVFTMIDHGLHAWHTLAWKNDTGL